MQVEVMQVCRLKICRLLLEFAPLDLAPGLVLSVSVYRYLLMQVNPSGGDTTYLSVEERIPRFYR